MRPALWERWIGEGRRIVSGEGRPEAEWWIVGEALGEKEEETGRVFHPDAKAGGLLRTVLPKVPVGEEQVYITNVLPLRPPGNKLERLGEIGVGLSEGMSAFREYLGVYRPRRVLLLGALAMETVCGWKGVEEWRGSAYQYEEGRWAVPSLHPSYIQRMGDPSAYGEQTGEGASKFNYGTARVTLILDARKAFLWGDLRPPNPTCYTSFTPREGIGRLREWKEKGEPLLVDVETKGEWVDLVGFAPSRDEAWSFSLAPSDWGGDWMEFQEALRELLRTHPRLAGQNLGFDQLMLERNGYEMAPIWYDLRVAHCWLYSDLPHDLAYQVSTYTTHPHYKWMRKEGEDVRKRYNCLDCALSFEVMERQVEELGEWPRGQERFWAFQMPLHREVLRMGMRGVRLDRERLGMYRRAFEKGAGKLGRNYGRIVGRVRGQQERWERMKEEGERVRTEAGERKRKSARKKVRSMRRKLVREFRSERNPASPKQVMELLYGVLKMKKQWKKDKDSGGKRLTSDEEALGVLLKGAKGEGRMVLRLLLALRDLEKKAGIAGMEPDEDGRLRTVYAAAGTATGRLSSSKTPWGSGWNSQNAPPWFRTCIVPDPGYRFLAIDLKQAEAILTLYFSGDEVGKECVRRKEDLHCLTASIIFQVRYEDVGRGDPRRKLAKPIRHGTNYRMGVVKLAQEAGIPRREAELRRNLLLASTPALSAWHEKVRKEVFGKRVLETPFGRRRWFWGRPTDDLLRKGVAFLPQACCVDATNTALLRMAEGIRERGLDVQLLLQVHDEVMMQYRVGDGTRERLMELVREAYHVPIWIEGEECVIPIEVKEGDRWGWMREVEVG